MLSKVASSAVVGLSATSVEVEIDIPNEGLPAFMMVGLPDKAVEEAKERVRSALKNSGADFPTGRITVNLAPADLPKVGPSFDLPIAVGIMIASEQLKAEITDAVFIGELSLDGTLRHTNGILPILYFAKDAKYKRAFVPYENSEEASVVNGIDVYPVKNFLELMRFFMENGTIPAVTKVPVDELLTTGTADF